MDLEELKAQMDQLEDVVPMGRTATGTAGGEVCRLMGLARRRDGALRLWLLRYDEAYREALEELRLSDPPPKPATNREWLARNAGLSRLMGPPEVTRIHMDELELPVEERRTSQADGWEEAALFARFMSEGWDPGALGARAPEDLYVTRLTFRGDYAAVSQAAQRGPVRLSLRPRADFHLVEQPVTLRVGGGPQRLEFADRGGTHHWAQIERVELYDQRAHLEQCLSRLRAAGRCSKTEEERQRLERDLAELAPAGYWMPVVEYECEEDSSLEFHTRDWLEAEPVESRVSRFYMARPDRPTGTLGLPLRAAVLEGQVPAGTTEIEAEVFSLHRVQRTEDILF